MLDRLSLLFPDMKSPMCKVVCLFLGQLLFVLSSAVVLAEPIGREITVPLDYNRPELGSARLYFEFGAPFVRTKPTVFIIADGQQFYVRRGAIQQLQKDLFGDEFNVVGIVSRGATPAFVKAALDQKGKTDWSKAWRIFNSDQWISDINEVRKNVVGANGKILLYGRSGGAYLVHQYLTRYGGNVTRVYTQSPVNPALNRELRIDIDRFWEELGKQDAELQPLLKSALAKHPEQRIPVLIALQRQHFFLSADALPAARAELIRAIERGDMQFLEQARKDYQVDDILRLHESGESIPQIVRVLELIYPSGAYDRLSNRGSIYPLLETQFHFQAPLINLLRQGVVRIPEFDFSALHKLTTEVFILAAQRDEAVDYRTSIALAHNYPRHELFIADDNHVFTTLNESGMTKQLLRSFLKYGLTSQQFREAIKKAEPNRWVER